MRKLKLEIDELRVETFETAERKGWMGTVWGNMPFKIPASDNEACGGGGSGGGDSGCETCPCTQKYSCPNGCSDFCTVVECPTYASGCC